MVKTLKKHQSKICIAFMVCISILLSCHLTAFGRLDDANKNNQKPKIQVEVMDCIIPVPEEEPLKEESMVIEEPLFAIVETTIAEQIEEDIVPQVKSEYEEEERQKEEEAARAQQAAQQASQASYNNWSAQPVQYQPSGSGSAAGQQIANYACSFAGWLPYASGGASLQTGADCCGFTMAVYAACGYSIPRTVEAQAATGYSVSREQAVPGDIVVYGGHVAIYIGGGQIVHSPVPGSTVTITNIDMMPVWDIRHIV